MATFFDAKETTMAQQSNADLLRSFANKSAEIHAFRYTIGAAQGPVNIGIWRKDSRGGGSEAPDVIMTPEKFREALAQVDDTTRAAILTKADDAVRNLVTGASTTQPATSAGQTPTPRPPTTGQPAPNSTQKSTEVPTAALNNALSDMPDNVRAALADTPSNQPTRKVMIEAMVQNPALTRALNAAGTQAEVVAALTNIRKSVPEAARPDIPGLEPVMSTADIVNRANKILGGGLTVDDKTALVTALNLPQIRDVLNMLREATTPKAVAGTLLNREFLRTVNPSVRQSIRVTLAAASASLNLPDSGTRLAVSDVATAPFLKEGGATSQVAAGTTVPGQTGGIA